MAKGWQFAGSGGVLLYFVTDQDTPNGRLAVLDAAKGSLPVITVVPETRVAIQGERLHDGELHLAHAEPNGTTVTRTRIPRP